MKSKYNIFIDGASRNNPGEAGIGILIKDNQETIKTIASYLGQTTNNVAEYMALIRGLEEALLLKIKEVHFYSDSELLVKQINGDYRVKNEGLKPLYIHAQSLIAKFSSFHITHIKRELNAEADELANLGIDNK